MPDGVLPGEETGRETQVELWASRVVAVSSEYGSNSWGANQILGEPKVYPKYGDLTGAWAQGNRSATEFIELEFEKQMYVKSVDIYETYHAGAVTRVSLKDPSGKWVTVYENSQPTCIETSRIFQPQLLETQFKTQHVRIDMNCMGNWCELDAVKLSGVIYSPGTGSGSAADKHVELWASHVVAFSSQYNSGSWCANQILGKPKVFPQYGDIVGSWAQQNCSAEEFIELEFEKELYVKSVDIYETYHAGAVTRVSLKDPSGKWVTVYQNNQPTCIQTSRIFQPNLLETHFKTRHVRIDMNCNGNWCELDAVKLSGVLYKLVDLKRVKSMGEEFSSMLNNPALSDIQLVVKGTTFFAHQVILAARSSYFRGLLCPEGIGPGGLYGEGTPTVARPPQPSKVLNIEGVPEAAMLGALQYMYTIDIVRLISPTTLLHIMRAAVRFDLQGLQTLCTVYLARDLAVSNVIPVVQEACNQPVLEVIKEICMEFISEHLSVVSRQPDFQQLPPDVILQLVQSSASKLSLK